MKRKRHLRRRLWEKHLRIGPGLLCDFRRSCLANGIADPFPTVMWIWFDKHEKLRTGTIYWFESNPKNK